MITLKNCDTTQDKLKAILSTHTYYVLKKIYWYWADEVAVFDSAEEAARYLNFSSYEDFLKAQDKLYEANKNNEGFRCYSIEKIDLVGMLDRIIESTVDRTITEERDKIVAESNRVIDGRAYCKARDWKEHAIELLKQLHIDG